MQHIMLDLETMGTKPGCAIVSIGAVKFDLDTGKIGDKFYQVVSLRSCIAVGLMPEASTIMWWLQQSEQARRKLYSEPGMHIHEMLTEFSKFCSADNAVWGNSAAFDCSILAEAYNKVGFIVPWVHWNERCFRTMKTLFPINYPKKDEARAHDPIYDCEYQIGLLCTIWKKFKGGNVVNY